jgi:hypothetical protein
MARQGAMYPPRKISTATLTTAGTGNIITSWTTTVSGAPYGNGVYTITASSAYTEAGALAYPPWKVFAFDDPADPTKLGGVWEQANPFRYVNGIWQSSFNTARFTLDGSYYGEWIHIQMPTGIVVTRCSLRAGGQPQRAPIKFRIYGSNDGTSWANLFSQTSALSYSNKVATVDIMSTSSYTYIGMVVSELPSDQTAVVLVFKSFEIYGVSFSETFFYVWQCIFIMHAQRFPSRCTRLKLLVMLSSRFLTTHVCACASCYVLNPLQGFVTQTYPCMPLMEYMYIHTCIYIHIYIRMYIHIYAYNYTCVFQLSITEECMWS